MSCSETRKNRECQGFAIYGEELSSRVTRFQKYIQKIVMFQTIESIFTASVTLLK